MTNYAIEIENLTKSYPNFTLGPINLKLPKGCIVGYIGENGSGKSTTIKAILGLVHPDTGSIKIFGEERTSSTMDRLGIVFDDLFAPGEMTINNLDNFCRMAYNTWSGEDFSKYLEKFNLAREQKVKTLSRGMKMKLSLAMALSHQADLLLLDEATSGLDPVVRDEILDIIMDFLQDEDHTVFISSHILSDLDKAADYIAFLHEGKLLFMEEKDRMVENYALCSVDNESLKTIDPEAIVGMRRHEFGVDLLVKRELMTSGFRLEKPSIEDIMIYIIKGEENESTNL